MRQRQAGNDWTKDLLVLLVLRISLETRGTITIPHPLSYPDATVTQFDAAVEIKGPITKCYRGERILV